MTASEMQLPTLLNMSANEGSVPLDRGRMLLWDADAFGALRRELIESVGVERARPILKRFGFANGRRDAGLTEKLKSWTSDEEWWSSCAALQRAEGKAQPELQHLKVDRKQGVFELELHWTHSYEAEQHARVYGRSQTPVCWTLAGFVSGFASGVMAEECLVIETQCVAMGADCCRLIGKTRKSWGTPGPALADEYTTSTPALPWQQPTSPRSRCMEEVLELCSRAAALDAPVLFTGEHGVGKSRLARMLHENSLVRQEALVAVNCVALPGALLESELFGHETGAFPGARERAMGALERAGHGTVFLEDVDALPLGVQQKLFHAIKQCEVTPLGTDEARIIHARVIASTSKDLEELSEAGRFDSALLEALRAISVFVPPLRSRREDILPLARHFVEELSRQQRGVADKSLSVEASTCLEHYLWPGNLRELENVINRALSLAAESATIEREHLPPSLLSGKSEIAPDRNFEDGEVMPMAELERRYVLEVLERFGGNRTHTAKALGIGANTLWRKLKGWGVPPARGETSYP